MNTLSSLPTFFLFPECLINKLFTLALQEDALPPLTHQAFKYIYLLSKVSGYESGVDCDVTHIVASFLDGRDIQKEHCLAACSLLL